MGLFDGVVDEKKLMAEAAAQLKPLAGETLADADARIRAIIADILNEYEAVLTFRRKDSKP